MKKVLFIPLLLLAGIQLKAQSVMFNLTYQPTTTYTINKDMKMGMSMTMPVVVPGMGDGKGIATDMSMTSVATVTTAARNPDKMIPIKFVSKIASIKTTMNGQEIPAGDAAAGATTVLYGKISPENKLLIDSTTGKKMDDSVRKAMLKLVESAQNGLKFPDQPMKPGDTFTQELPFSVPMPGIAGSSVTVKMTYKLVSITGNTAAFDFIETLGVNLNPAAQNQNVGMTMSGTGSGSISYDISKQFYTTMTNNLDLTFSINVNGMDMKSKCAIVSIDKVDIAVN